MLNDKSFEFPGKSFNKIKVLMTSWFVISAIGSSSCSAKM
jgi:hypothetical protein